MALAILEPEAFESNGVRLKIDTGTNRYFRLKVGKSVEPRFGIDWVEDVFFFTPIRTNDHGGSLLNSSMDVVLPVRQLANENPYAYVQLFSFKSPDGRAAAFSKVLKIPRGPSADFGLVPSLSLAAGMNTATTFRDPRVAIPCMTYADKYEKAASIEDLLAGILKVAAPVVQNLLTGEQKKDRQQNTQMSGSSDGKGITDILATLLKTVLGGLQGQSGAATSLSQSVNGKTASNRFSQPFIFGIDDALFGALIGQVVQVLPQLANAANQERIQLKQSTNKLITDVLSDVNRRMLMEQLLQAQRQPQATPAGGDGEISQLIQLLQQAPAAQASASPVPAAIAGAKSLSVDDRNPSRLSRALVAFNTADLLLWNGKQKAVFSKTSGIQFKVRMVVGDPVPKNSLSKAIFKFVFKHHSDSSVLFEKTFKQKNVAPNTDLYFSFSSADLATLPTNKILPVLVELRWPASNGDTEHKALGSTEIVLVSKYFVKEQGAAVSAERELIDMKQFRPFWNKIWEAPTLDAVNNSSGDQKKYLWAIDANTKYSVLLSPDHNSNGLMETKILSAGADGEDLTARTEGRMKAGIELSIAELNKLLPLWDGETSLDPDKLEAVCTHALARSAASEFVYPLKLKGKAADRGMVWVVPVFKLFEFTLNTVQKTDENGQVISISDEQMHFPLPVAARILGVKSDQ